MGRESGDQRDAHKMSKLGPRYLRLMVFVGGLVLSPLTFAAHVNPHPLITTKPKSTQRVSESQRTRHRMRHLARSRTTSAHPASLTRTSASRSSLSQRRHAYRERFYMSSFAAGITGGDGALQKPADVSGGTPGMAGPARRLTDAGRSHWVAGGG